MRLTILREIPGTSYLINKDSSLKFYLPPGGDFNELRLIDILRFKSGDDSLFYYNSLLYQHLQLQLRYPERKVFVLAFDQKSNEKEYIKRIVVDDNILALSLVTDNNFWSQPVSTATDSLFPHFLFMRLASAWVPLGDYRVKDSLTPVNPIGLTVQKSLGFFAKIRQKEIINDVLLNDYRVFEIRFDNTKSIQFTKKNDTLYLYCKLIGDIRIQYPGYSKVYPIRGGAKRVIEIPRTAFEIQFMGSNSHLPALYCSWENPFNQISYLVHHNQADYRFSIPRNGADLFSAVMARKIPEVENIYSPLKRKADSIFRLCYNPILAGYVQDEIKSYLQKDTALSRYLIDTSLSVKMAATIMNTSNAEVLAVPWFYPRDSSVKDFKNLIILIWLIILLARALSHYFILRVCAVTLHLTSLHLNRAW